MQHHEHTRRINVWEQPLNKSTKAIPTQNERLIRKNRLQKHIRAPRKGEKEIMWKHVSAILHRIGDFCSMFSKQEEPFRILLRIQKYAVECIRKHKGKIVKRRNTKTAVNVVLEWRWNFRKSSFLSISRSSTSTTLDLRISGLMWLRKFLWQVFLAKSDVLCLSNKVWMLSTFAASNEIDYKVNVLEPGVMLWASWEQQFRLVP